MAEPGNRIKNYLTNSIPDFEIASVSAPDAKGAAHAATPESDDVLHRFVPAREPKRAHAAGEAHQGLEETIRDIVELARKARERNVALAAENDGLRRQLAEQQLLIDKLQNEKAALQAAASRPVPSSVLSEAIQESAFFNDGETKRPEFRMPADRMIPPLKEPLS